MRLIAIETSAELCSAALLRDGDLLVEEAPSDNRHSDLLISMTRRLLDRAHLRPSDLDGLGFGQGPGSFTGIRIACGVVQGIALGAGRPVVAVPSLLALAEQSNAKQALVAIDARMGECYLAGYLRDGDDWKEVVAPCLCDRLSLPAIPGGRWVATGSGFDRSAWLREHLGRHIDLRIEGDLPRAGSIARVASRWLGQGRGVPAERAAPLYVREKVAMTTLERQTRA